MRRETVGVILIAAITLSAVIFMVRHEPVAQDLGYHAFSDCRPLFSIPNFWNVISSVPFLLIGVFGLRQLLVAKTLNIIEENRSAYLCLFAAVALIAFGSAYYHLAPQNRTLLWDRLPMTIAFMALSAIVISEFVSPLAGRVLLWPLLLAGVASVAYWHVSELRGAGDLRYYAFVQFYPLLVMPVILGCFRTRCGERNAYWWLLAAYVGAKVFELYDAEVYRLSGLVGGHAFKHVVVALGLFVLLRSYEHRRCPW